MDSRFRGNDDRGDGDSFVIPGERLPRRSRPPKAETRLAAGFPCHLVRWERQADWMFDACLPFGPWVTSKLTFWPSFSVLKPSI